MITPETLAPLIARHLGQQRWYAGRDHAVAAVSISDFQVLKRGWPGLVWAVAEVEPHPAAAQADASRWQLLIGLRERDDEPVFFEGKAWAQIGHLRTELGPGHAYDALIDPELAIEVFRVAAPGVDVPARVRPPGVEQSNTSLVYDEQWMLKVYRRLYDDPNPDAEMVRALAEQGFPNVIPPNAHWRRGTTDLAMVQRYLADAVEGWSLALTSLRDLYANADELGPDGEVDPSKAGGDLGAEAERLGRVTAEMHAALGDAFGRLPGDPGVWAYSVGARLGATSHEGYDARAADRIVRDLAALRNTGPSVRVHGDYHLGQVIRTDTGWYVVDFEGEPDRPLYERRQPSSPMKDVAGMLRSFHYASRAALIERSEAAVLAPLADAWEHRNRQAFLDGYLPIAEEAGLLPSDAGAWPVLLAAFELDKALYELTYERAHRPDWVDIPLHALHRLTAAAG